MSVPEAYIYDVVRTPPLMGVLLEGKRMRPGQALEMGLIDELVAAPEELVPAPYPAPVAIMSAAVEGAGLDIDSASRVEARYFAGLATGQTSKNMIRAFFFDLQKANGLAKKYGSADRGPIEKVVVLGAGMMGAAIAYVCAKSGMNVVLKDIDQSAAERGKGYAEKLVAKTVSRADEGEARDKAQAKGDALLARITPTTDPAAAAGAQAVIEAVFEYPNTARVAANAISAEVVAREAEGVEFSDIQHLVAGARGRKVFEDGDMDAGIWSAGQCQGLIDDIPTAAELVDRMVAEAEELITSRLAGMVETKESLR